MTPGTSLLLNDQLPEEALAAISRIREADIVVGIPSYNNARTIPHVVRAAQAGLAKYFPQARAVIVNSDGGSVDGTRESVVASSIEEPDLLFLSTPLYPLHRLSFPYHGIPGKGSAFRMIFRISKRLNARACAVVDSDLRSITPEWIDLLLRPVLHAGFDLVAPYYLRHKYDGTITNSIVYPVTRALYGSRVRQPIGGEFGISRRLFLRFLQRNDWETDTARYGIDIWMTTIALAEKFRVCQSYLGAKLHDAKDPGADLSSMLLQVVGSLFALMEEYEPAWIHSAGSEDVELFGFRFGVALDPVRVDVARMLETFRRACADIGEVWALGLKPATHSALLELGRKAGGRPEEFRFADGLWVEVIWEFAAAFRRRVVPRPHLLRSLLPLYLARVASFVEETREFNAEQVEEAVERLCLSFESAKSNLAALWRTPPGTAGRPAR